MPTTLRSELLKLARDDLTAGYLSSSKTFFRLLKSFFGPKIFEELKDLLDLWYFLVIRQGAKEHTPPLPREQVDR